MKNIPQTESNTPLRTTAEPEELLNDKPTEFRDSTHLLEFMAGVLEEKPDQIDEVLEKELELSMRSGQNQNWAEGTQVDEKPISQYVSHIRGTDQNI